MSEISNIYSRYRETLDWGLDDFETSRLRAKEAIERIYNPFIENLIHNYGNILTDDPGRKSEILNVFQEQFGDGHPEVNFVAIDGTCGKEQLSEIMIFYAASYAQNGTLNLNDSLGRISYSRWTPREDTSFVAYLPIPLNVLAQLEDEDWLFRADDDERSSAAMIQNSLMQLAEIYLAYKRVTSEDHPPKVILLDHSMSSILLSTDVMDQVRPYAQDKRTLGWIGADIPRWRRSFEPIDGLVAHSHPMNKDLQVPSLRGNALYARIVAEMTDFWHIGITGERDPDRLVPISNFLLPGVDLETLKDRIRTASQLFNAFELDEDVIRPSLSQDRFGQRRTLRQRWYDLRLLFEDICERLFRERRLDALKFTYPLESGRPVESKWMGDNDIRFIIGTGLRLLIEICWQKKVLLLGIAKDSSSRYFFKNFLSVVDAANLLSVPRDSAIGFTDRGTCEALPLIDNRILSPWSTLEFDSVFMTMRALLDAETNQPKIQGVHGNILAPSDGLFLRCLAQFFLSHRSNKDSPLMGHVLFLDRIAYPYFDMRYRSTTPLVVDGSSSIRPIIRLNNDERNLVLHNINFGY